MRGRLRLRTTRRALVDPRNLERGENEALRRLLTGPNPSLRVLDVTRAAERRVEHLNAIDANFVFVAEGDAANERVHKAVRSERDHLVSLIASIS